MMSQKVIRVFLVVVYCLVFSFTPKIILETIKRIEYHILLYLVIAISIAISITPFLLKNQYWKVKSIKGQNILQYGVLVIILHVVNNYIFILNNEGYSLFFSFDRYTNFYTINSLIVLLIIAPLTEEFVYRGVLSEYLLEVKIDNKVIIFLSAFMFSIIHYYNGFHSMLFTFIFGGILCSIYLKERNLLYVVLLHMLNNFLSTFILISEVS